MIIVRGARPERDFTIIANAVLRDGRLSYRARGLLAFILSLPDNYRVAADRLAEQGTEGRDAIRTSLSELSEFGYLTRQKLQGEGGLWETIATITDQPTTGNPASDSPAPDNPAVGFPGANKKTDNKTKKKEKAPPQVLVVTDETTGRITGLQVSDELLADFGKAYPALNINQQIARAVVWLNANPANRKSNYDRFLANWMTRAQDSAPRVLPATATQQSANGFTTGRRPVHESWLNLGRTSPPQPPMEGGDVIDVVATQTGQ